MLNDLKFITLGYVDSKLASDREVKASTDLLAPSWGRQRLNLLFFIELENCPSAPYASQEASIEILLNDLGAKCFKFGSE